MWTDWRVFSTSDKGRGNIAETSDGRAVIVYSTGADNSVRVAFASTVIGVLDGSENFGAATVLDDGYGSQPFCSINLVDGKLRVVVVYLISEGTYAAEYWADSDGKGADFAKVADIALDLNDASGMYPSVIQQLGNGNLAVVLPYTTASLNDGIWPHYSTDDGATWTPGATWNGGLVYFMTYYHSRNLLVLGDDDYLLMRTASTSKGTTLYVSGSGATVQAVDWSGDWAAITGQSIVGHATPYAGGWVQVGDKIYLAATQTGVGAYFGILEFVGATVSAAELAKAENYISITRFADAKDGWHFAAD